VKVLGAMVEEEILYGQGLPGYGKALYAGLVL
jgi:hypothetical protein